jgi:chemotaxis protein CheY-P-specific phosphatase CheC
MNYLLNNLIDWEHLAQCAASVAAERLGLFLSVPVIVDSIDVAVEKIQPPGVKEKFLKTQIVGSVIKTTDPTGCILVALSAGSATNLVRVAYQGLPDPPTAWDERGRSAITEAGNIVSGAFVSELNNRASLAIRFGTPGFVHDMLGAVLDELTSVVCSQADTGVWVRVNLGCAKKNIDVQLCFVGT